LTGGLTFCTVCANVCARVCVCALVTLHSSSAAPLITQQHDRRALRTGKHVCTRAVLLLPLNSWRVSSLRERAGALTAVAVTLLLWCCRRLRDAAALHPHAAMYPSLLCDVAHCCSACARVLGLTTRGHRSARTRLAVRRIIAKTESDEGHYSERDAAGIVHKASTDNIK
jgi:hypothetical protein